MLQIAKSMAKLIVSLKIKDAGYFHNSYVKFQLHRQEEETLFIYYSWYNTNYIFLPCTAIQKGNTVLLSKAGVGQLGDVKMPLTDFVKVLSALRSRTLLNEWKQKLLTPQTA